MATGKRAASTASRPLKSKRSTPAQRRVAGSDLAQTPRRKPAGGKGRSTR